MALQNQARAEYDHRRQEIKALLHKISEGLDGHREAFDAGGDWGYVGDLGDIRSGLRGISDRLWSEGEYAGVA
jgi:hypothetical protein